jgi:uncharacterized membrane protein
MHTDDKYKTGCVGILMPLALVGYALLKIVWHYRRDRYEFRYRSPESIEWSGVSILGMALFAHALGFVPYRRYPIVRWLLVAVSIIMFFYGMYASVMSWEGA